MRKSFLIVFFPYCDGSEKYREFTNNVSSYQFLHNASITCNNCRNVYIDCFCRYQSNPTCSYACYVKYTIPCNDCQSKNKAASNSVVRFCLLLCKLSMN